MEAEADEAGPAEEEERDEARPVPVEVKEEPPVPLKVKESPGQDLFQSPTEDVAMPLKSEASTLNG